MFGSVLVPRGWFVYDLWGWKFVYGSFVQDSQAMDVILSKEPGTDDHVELDPPVFEDGTIGDVFRGEVFHS